MDLTVAQESAVAANLELAREAGSRYLVQRWGDGEICDKTGKRREVEVQVRSTHIRTREYLIIFVVPLLDDYDRHYCLRSGSQNLLLRLSRPHPAFVR